MLIYLKHAYERRLADGDLIVGEGSDDVAEAFREVDRVVKYGMAELRRLAGSQATQDELRSLLTTFFEPPVRWWSTYLPGGR